MNIPLSRPDITEAEIDAVVSVLRTPHLSLGPKLAEFEDAFAAYIGVPHAVALSSGTAGLHVGLQTLGIGEGDEVILPSFTFIAAANAVLYRGATPVFADIDPLTLNITAASIERVLTPKTRAILLVHTFGHPADLDPIIKLAAKHNLRVIEDACEAIGAEYQGRKIGSFGDLAVFSFYPNKPITTGEGGIVVTRDPSIARHMRALRNQGRMQNDGWLEHTLLGYNYRLSDINCALGIAQLKRIDEILARRESVARCYFEAVKGVTPPPMNFAGGRISWFAYVVRLPRTTRSHVMKTLIHQGIECRPYFPPIHLQPLYSSYGHDLPVTQDIAFRTLALPFFNHLKDEQVQRVCTVLTDALQHVEKTPGILEPANLSSPIVHGDDFPDR
jgi:perosamine synthetase